MATATHGSLSAFKLADAADALQDITAYLTTNGLAQAIDNVDVSHLGDTNKHYIAGLEDHTFDIGGNLDPTIDGHLNSIKRLPKAFEYYPLGIGSGMPKYVGTCFIQDYSMTTPVNDAGKFTGKAQVSGAVTRTLVP
jgi:hypothetical protein